MYERPDRQRSSFQSSYALFDAKEPSRLKAGIGLQDSSFWPVTEEAVEMAKKTVQTAWRRLGAIFQANSSTLADRARSFWEGVAGTTYGEWSDMYGSLIEAEARFTILSGTSVHMAIYLAMAQLGLSVSSCGLAIHQILAAMSCLGRSGRREAMQVAKDFAATALTFKEKAFKGIKKINVRPWANQGNLVARVRSQFVPFGEGIECIVVALRIVAVMLARVHVDS